MDKALKQRLVGASVLIILAVIVLPMLLSGRSDTLQQESRQIELPPKPEELSIETRRFPVGLPNKPTVTPVQEVADPLNAETSALQTGVVRSESDSIAGLGEEIQSPVNSEQIPDSIADSVEAVNEAQQASSEQALAAVAKPPAVTSITLKSGRDKGLEIEESVSASPDSPRYLVQVASFSSERNANALASRLRADQLPVLMDVVDRSAGRMHRVRVGPYAERSEADNVVAKLKSNMKDIAPRVLDLRPSDSAPVSKPSDSLVRWVVQVGSFSNSKAADILVADLRLGGMTAFSEKVSSASGTTYKVRIGPELDRDKAVELARKVKAERKLDGFVTTQE
jgi:DedD protein